MDDIDRIVAEVVAVTEKWCRKAIARGEGCRVWRSEARYETDALGYRLVHEYQILGPGEPPPASGTVYGPWPSSVRQRIMEGQPSD